MTTPSSLTKAELAALYCDAGLETSLGNQLRHAVYDRHGCLSAVLYIIFCSFSGYIFIPLGV